MRLQVTLETWHLPGWKCICQVFCQSCSLLRSSCRISVSLCDDTARYSIVSSAKRCRLMVFHEAVHWCNIGTNWAREPNLEGHWIDFSPSNTPDWPVRESCGICQIQHTLHQQIFQVMTRQLWHKVVKLFHCVQEVAGPPLFFLCRLPFSQHSLYSLLQ